MLRRTTLVFFCSVLSCSRTRVDEPERHFPPPPSAAPLSPPLSTRLSRPARARVVAVGDLHGDLDHARRAFRLAGAIDEHDRWIGADLLVVQTGDEIDRGDDDRAILDLVESMRRQASAAGGEVIPLLGNHEIMNASLDFRYVTPPAFAAFSPSGDASASPAWSRLPADEKGRATAFAPGGSYAGLLASRSFVVEVGDAVFVHGGILPAHVAYGLDRMNDELDSWLAGTTSSPPARLVAEDGPVWTRAYSREDAPADCARLSQALASLHAKRMIVGHTVQRSGANSACDGKVWRIDVGLSRYFGGPIEVLEIRGDAVRVLREAGRP